MVHRKGYHCWVYGAVSWHRTFEGAKRCADRALAWSGDHDNVQVIDVPTGARLY